MNRCGDSGGTTRTGAECRQRVAEEGSRCPRHPVEGEPLVSVGGRPAVELSDDQIAQIERLAAVVQEDELCFVLGIPERTFRAIKARDERVSAAYKRGRANVKVRAGQTLMQLALGRTRRVVDASSGEEVVVETHAPDKASLFFMLKTQFGYRETERRELVGDPAQPLALDIDVSKLSTDELHTLDQLLTRAAVALN